MQAIVLAVGDELVLGQTVDTNSAFISAKLARHGINTAYQHTVGDDQIALSQAITAAADQADLVIITGGIGPTEDDLTRQSLADAMNVELVEDPDSVAKIQAFFKDRGKTPSPNNLIQALHPQSSSMIDNSCGTAPGIKANLGRATIYVTPGVPFEMKAMFELSIAPELWAPGSTTNVSTSRTREQADSPTPANDSKAVGTAKRYILTAKLNSFGMGESSVATTLGDLMARDRNPVIGTTVTDGIISVRVRSEGSDRDRVENDLENSLGEVETLLGALVFGRDDQTLEQSLVRLLIESNLTLATAESCTGGLIGSMITSVGGSSAIYQGGWVTYSNQMKIDQLQVSADLIDRHGAVSEEVARAMASGARRFSGADLGIGITGIAGPTGGTEDKPVGTVWVALAYGSSDREDAITTDARLLKLGGSRASGASAASGGVTSGGIASGGGSILPGQGGRDLIRDRAAKYVLQMLRYHLMGESLDALSPPRERETNPDDIGDR